MTTEMLDRAVWLDVARTVVEHGRRAKLAIRGTSMLPMVREPMTIDVVSLRRPARVGDVLVFRDRDAYVAHRVIARDGDGYRTSGDGNPEVVESVPPDAVLGVVDAVWSDASAGARRVDTLAHRLRGIVYARARPARVMFRAVVGATLRRLRGPQEK